MAKSDWKNKRCPKCGSAVDAFESCRSCGRAWSESLKAEEVAVDAEGNPIGRQYDAVVYPVKKTQRKSRHTKSTKPGEKDSVFSEDLPARFNQWEIHKHDNEMEIYSKRSLMRLDSRKIYNQMGLAVRAHETQKATLLWLSGLMEFLDDEEQKALAPIVERLKIVFDVLAMVRQSKIAQAAKMEKAMEKAYAQARKVRAQAAEKAKKAQKPTADQDTEGLGTDMSGLDPKVLLEQAREKLLALDKAKQQRKLKSEPAENPFEE